jgi:prevent-host-death family protein
MVMVKANVVEMKARLSEFLDRAARGERIVICRHNKPVAELRAVEELRTEPRPIGPLPERPTFEIPASFFEPMPADELALWEGVKATDPLSPAWTSRAERRASAVVEKKGKDPRGRRRPVRRRS